MARFIGVAFGFAVVVLLQCAAAQTVYVVGDSMGWTVPQGGAQAYQNWANGKNFAVGDILTFNFATNAHDVVRVPKASYDDCSSSNAIGDTITTGPVNITLDTAGEHYYICTFSQHCQFGQKLYITVAGTPGASPPSTPTPPRTPTTPSPASNNTPADCAPTPASSPKASGPRGSASPVSPGPTIPPPPGSSSTNILAGVLVSMLAIIVGLFF